MARVALGNRAHEQALGQRRHRQKADRASPRRLPADGHLARIAAERGNVAPHPLQQRNLIEHTVIARCTVAAFPAQCRRCEEAKRAEAIVEGHHDDALARQVLAVELRIGGGAFVEAAAIDPDEHRPALARRRAAVQTFTVRQSSLIARPAASAACCGQTAPNRSACLTPCHGAGRVGRRKRRSPTGGATKGMPRNALGPCSRSACPSCLAGIDPDDGNWRTGHKRAGGQCGKGQAGGEMRKFVGLFMITLRFEFGDFNSVGAPSATHHARPAAITRHAAAVIALPGRGWSISSSDRLFHR